MSKFFQPRSRVPFMPQMELGECGAACLGMVMAYHGYYVPLSEIRETCGTSRDGASALAIVHAARTFGFESNGVRTELPDLNVLPLPAILHWRFDHFVVLDRIDEEGAVLIDPGSGTFAASYEELSRNFTGIALLIRPTARTPRRPPPQRKRWPYRLVKLSQPSAVQFAIAALLLPVLSIVLPVATQLGIDMVSNSYHISFSWILAGAVITSMLAHSVLIYVRSCVIDNFQVSLDWQMKRSFVSHLFKLPVPFFLSRAIGDLANRVETNSTIDSLVLTNILLIISDSLIFLIYAVLVLWYSLKLGGLVILLAACGAAVIMLLGNLTEKAASSESATNAEWETLAESLSAIETMAVNSSEASLVRRWLDSLTARINRDMFRRKLEIDSFQVTVLAGAGTLGVLYIVGSSELNARTITYGMWASLWMAQSVFVIFLQSLFTTINKIRSVRAGTIRRDEIVACPPEMRGAKDHVSLSGDIRMEKISFQYSPRDPLIFSELDLEFRPGERVVLVGRSGAGKSTLIRMLLGVLRPTAGHIYFDGHRQVDLAPSAFHHHIGAVVQESYTLLNETVRFNISLGHAEISIEEIKFASQLAAIHEEITKFPDGYDTPVGENGNRLSAGQRQRLCLARALLRRPPILILDEPTNALDPLTEQEVYGSLSQLGCTIILATHRLEAVRWADRIVVLADGQVVQQGQFPELRDQPGIFQELHRAGDFDAA